MLITAALAWMARLSDCTRLEQLSSLTESSTRIPGQMPTSPVPLSDALATAATAVPCSSVTGPVDVLATCPASSLWLSLACESAIASSGLLDVTGGGVIDCATTAGSHHWNPVPGSDGNDCRRARAFGSANASWPAASSAEANALARPSGTL